MKYMTLQEFADTTKESSETWYYFDYKYMQEWFNNKPEIVGSLNWRKFGIDKDGCDSTIWIGSKGAHTNCHQDSYGYNLVAQIHGRFVLMQQNKLTFSFICFAIAFLNSTLFFIGRNGYFSHRARTIIWNQQESLMRNQLYIASLIFFV